MISFRDFHDISVAIDNAFLTEEYKAEWKHLGAISTHRDMIGGSRVKIVAANRLGIHQIDFEVDGQTTKMNWDSPRQGHRILTHVGNQIRRYAKEKVRSGDKIVMVPFDTNKGVQDKKNLAYRMFGRKLAREIGGTHEEKPMASGGYYHIIKKT